MRNHTHVVVALLVGVLLGALLSHTPAVEAQVVQLMLGSYNNAAKAVVVDTNGYVQVVTN